MKQYTPEELEAFYEGEKAGKISCKGHDMPSKETIKMVDNLKTTIQVNAKIMENLSEKIDEGFRQNKEDHKEIKDLFNTKANKWVEDAIVRLNWIVILTVVGAILTLIFKK